MIDDELYAREHVSACVFHLSPPLPPLFPLSYPRFVASQGSANGSKRRREVAIQVGGSLLQVGGLAHPGLHPMDPPRKHSKKGSLGLGARGETGGLHASWGLPMSQHVQGAPGEVQGLWACQL